MSGLLDRLGALFLAPPTAADAVHREGLAASSADRPTGPPAVAVLARAGDAWVAGAVVALALAARGAGPTAVVATWPAVLPAVHAPAAPGARRLAARLTGRGHAARATARLVLVALDGDAAEALTQMRRIEAAAGETPVVRVLAGPRGDLADRELARSDRIVVAATGDDDTVAGLAAAGLPGASMIRLDAPTAARTLAAAGLALVAPLRAAADEALGP